MQHTFQRYEKKYILDSTQHHALTDWLSAYTKPDDYGLYTISNIYYDTDDYALIRSSIEGPLFKEKLRMRCYGKANTDTTVFLELKRKFKGEVYKRRISLPYSDAMHFMSTGSYTGESSQILREIQHFMTLHAVSAKVYLYYERQALFGLEDEGLRITFDSNMRFRQTELRLDNGTCGTALLQPGQALMEIKVPGAFPLWLSRQLSEMGIFPASFSKYGASYKNYIHKDVLKKGGAYSA